MKFTELPLKGAYVVEIEAFEDQRGMFERIFCENEFNEIEKLIEAEQCAGVQSDVESWLAKDMLHTYEAADGTIDKLKKMISG